jgi:hypothetical protein
VAGSGIEFVDRAEVTLKRRSRSVAVVRSQGRADAVGVLQGCIRTSAADAGFCRRRPVRHGSKREAD